MLMLLVLKLALISVFGQDLVNCTSSEVSNYSSEVTNNKGGGNQNTLGKGSGYGYYAMLIRADLAGLALKLPCTLFVRQYAFTSGGTAYDYADGEFNVEVSTVKGAWNSGSSLGTPEEGASCWKYRGYSAANPVAWDPADPAPGLQSISRGNGGSHINSSRVVLKTGASAELSYAVLDSQLAADLVNGCGGLLLSRNQDELATQIRFWASPSGKPVMLRWDPAGRAVARELAPVGIRSLSRLACSPNPFRHTTAIRFNGAVGSLPVRVHDASGRLVRTLVSNHGTALWDGLGEGNRPLSAGIYLFTVNDGAGQIVRSVNLAR